MEKNKIFFNNIKMSEDSNVKVSNTRGFYADVNTIIARTSKNKDFEGNEKHKDKVNDKINDKVNDKVIEKKPIVEDKNVKVQQNKDVYIDELDDDYDYDTEEKTENKDEIDSFDPLISSLNNEQLQRLIVEIQEELKIREMTETRARRYRKIFTDEKRKLKQGLKDEEEKEIERIRRKIEKEEARLSKIKPKKKVVYDDDDDDDDNSDEVVEVKKPKKGRRN